MLTHTELRRKSTFELLAEIRLILIKIIQDV